jgi:uncharacterized protein (TIGR00645 family)
MHTETKKRTPRGVKLIENVLFNVKWVLPLFYLGLAIVLLLYGYTYAKEIIHVVREAKDLTTEQMKLVALDFVDLVMIANLMKLIIAGSYNSFVSKTHGQPNENNSSGTLKNKIATSVIVFSMINLLGDFLGKGLPLEAVKIKLMIFVAFLIASLVLGVMEFLHVKCEAIESESEHE